MVSFAEAMTIARETDPVEQIRLAAQHVSAEADFDAMTVTLAPPQRPDEGHEVVYAHGYEPENLRYLRTTHVTADPRYRELVQYRVHSFGWQEPADFVESHAATRWLIPAGHRDGASLCLRNESGGEIGSLHVNTRTVGWNAARVGALTAFYEFVGHVLRPVHEWAGFRLTPRETAIARLVMTGASNPQIAEELWLSRSTVKTHIENIMAKLDVDSRVGIAVAVARFGAHPEGGEIGRMTDGRG